MHKHVQNMLCLWGPVFKTNDVVAWQKLLSFFFNKNISVVGFKVVKHVTSWPLSELIKLTIL